MPTLLFLTATWSAPGRLMEPMIRKIARERRIPYRRLLVDEDPSLIGTNGVTTVPELVLVEGGWIIRRWMGLCSEIEIRSDLEAMTQGST